MAVGGAEPRHRGRDLELVVRAFEDWRPLHEQFAEVQRGDYAYYMKPASDETVLLLGDSHIEQYGPRVDRLLSENSAQYKTAMFATMAGCMPSPSVLEDQHPNCETWLEWAIALAESDEVDSIVIGGCWNCYLIDSVRDASAVPGLSTYEYYYLDGGERKYFGRAKVRTWH